MRARIATGPLRTTAAQYARSRFIQAQTFLTWTAALGVRPSALTQAHIDAYYASHGTHQREGVRAFLVWAAGHGHIPRHLDIPRQQPYAGQVITQQRRLDLLRRFATDTAIPVRPRAAACLMLLYAQPLSRILRLSAADLSLDDDGQTWLRLGDPPSPVPAPFGALLHQLAATRHDHVPANYGSDWLFPGRNAGQPAEYRSIAAQLREHGLPLRTARVSALRQLVLQVPAPVVADALGFHHTTTTRQHVNAGATWSHYVAGSPAIPTRTKVTERAAGAGTVLPATGPAGSPPPATPAAVTPPPSACWTCCSRLRQVIPEPKPGSCGKLSANPRVEHEQNPAQHLATIQPLTARMSGIARDDRQQRLDARPQSVVDLPRLGASLPRPGWLASPSAAIGEN